MLQPIATIWHCWNSENHYISAGVFIPLSCQTIMISVRRIIGKTPQWLWWWAGEKRKTNHRKNVNWRLPAFRFMTGRSVRRSILIMSLRPGIFALGSNPDISRILVGYVQEFSEIFLQCLTNTFLLFAGRCGWPTRLRWQTNWHSFVWRRVRQIGSARGLCESLGIRSMDKKHYKRRMSFIEVS